MVAPFGVSRTATRRNHLRRVSEPIELPRDEAWALTREISPRPTVRIAARDGELIVNRYPTEEETSGPAPKTTWAVNLAGEDGLFRYLVFDLDVKDGNVVRDRDRLCAWLDDLNIEYLVARSGPEGGIHVWVALDEPTDAHMVKDIGKLAKQLLPTLDTRPLSNAIAGCVRPPGAPHRTGSSSIVIRGDLDVLRRHDTLEEQVEALRDMFLDLGATLEPTGITPIHNVKIDDQGRPHLGGLRRALSPRILDLIEDPDLTGDLSYRLHTVLCALANARYTYSEARDEYGDSPAFEHARTLRHSKTLRVLRDAKNREKVLRGAWERAVEFVAANPPTRMADDPEVYRVMYEAVRSVERALDRADSMPGFWGGDRASNTARATKRHTYRQRAVFDTVLLFMLQAGATTVEADQRRIAIQTGYGKTQVGVALHELTKPQTPGDPESAWLVKVGVASGRAAQKYRLSERFSTEGLGLNRPQVISRPSSPTLQVGDLRRILMTRILNITEALATDTFAAPHSYGRTSGIVYALLPEEGALPVEEAARRAGMSTARVKGHLKRLSHANLVHRTRDGAWRRGRGSLKALATRLEVVGYLAARAARFVTDRQLWAWWCAEERWMSAKRSKQGRSRRLSPSIALFAMKTGNDWPRYPRDHRGRGNHRAARRIIEAGLGSVKQLDAA